MNANEGHFQNSVVCTGKKITYKVFQPKLDYVVAKVLACSAGQSLDIEEVKACCKASISQIMSNLDFFLFGSINMSKPHEDRTMFLFPKILEIVKAFNPHVAYFTARRNRIIADVEDCSDIVDSFFDSLELLPKSDVACYWFENKDFYVKKRQKLNKNSFFELNSYVFGYLLHWELWDDQRFDFSKSKEPDLGRKALYVTNECSHPAFNECLAFSENASFLAKFLNQRQAGVLKTLIDEILDGFVKMAISPEARQLRAIRRLSFDSKLNMPYSSEITPAFVDKVVTHKVILE